MKPLMQREWLIDVLEASPSVVFTALLRSNVDLQLEGWIGAALAALQLGSFYYLRFQHNPIMLGINVHLLLITPTIMVAYWSGFSQLGHVLETHSYQGVLITVWMVGAILTVVADRGFIGVAGLSLSHRVKLSGILLSASAASIFWGFARAENPLVSVILPLIALFGLRRYLVARTYDRNDLVGGIGLIGGSSAVAASADPGVL